jgi:Chaperone of endosialidase/Head domain of trimeric autotransporter adhesin
MKKLLLLSAIIVSETLMAQNVGIGTTTPVARLHVTDSSVLFSAPGGASFTPGNPSVSGQGRRLMWYADKAAFRVGFVNGSQWDKDSIGNYSFASGLNAKAKGLYAAAIGFQTSAAGNFSIAMGDLTTASGDNSTAMGQNTIASGVRATAMGQNTKASGFAATAMGSSTTAGNDYSIAMGNGTTGSGVSSTAMGFGTIASGYTSTAMGISTTAGGWHSTTSGNNTVAKGFSSTVLGMYNDSILINNENSISPTTPLFIVGNGNGNTNRSNAITILKNGNTGIGTNAPVARLHITDSSVLFSALGDVPVISGLPPVQGAGRRMMWYPGKAAFRVGYVDNAYWDDFNIGNYSFATGLNTVAFGSGSTALGGYTLALGNYSTVMGIYSNASGIASTALGNETTATGAYATASGEVTTASGRSSITMGGFTSAIGDYSTAIGYGTNAKAYGSFSMGTYNDITDNPDPLIPDLSDRIFQIGNGPASFFKNNAVTVLRNGNTGFGFTSPLATLEVARGAGSYGTAAFHGTTHISHFNFGTDEDTYIRAGKDNRNVIINDIPGGKVGIGMTNPNSPLSFANTVGKKISLYESGSNSHYGFSIQGGQLQMYSDAAAAKITFGFYTGGSYTERMFLNNSTGTLTVAGINYPSDARYKKQITHLQNPLEKIMAINGVEYYMRTDQFPLKHFDDKLQVGLIAQEVEKILPQVVQTGDDGYKAIDYAKLVPLLVEGIKEQQHLIEKQQQQIDELKKLVQKLLNQ